MSRTTDLGRLGRRVGRERLVEQLLERLRVRDRLEQLHALVVLDALGLHRLHRLAPGLVLLLREDRPRVVERRLDHAHHVERVRGRLAVEQLEDGDGEGRQRLVEREVGLQVDREGDPRGPAVGVGLLVHDPRGPQRPVDREGAPG
jgi:hypothetical protein